MRFHDANAFFKEQPPKDLYYVGFLKMNGAWIPLCVVREPGASERLDTMVIGREYEAVKEAVDAYADRVAAVEEIFVQFLLVEEIGNLAERYGVSWIGELDSQVEGGCGCGCGCG